MVYGQDHHKMAFHLTNRAKLLKEQVMDSIRLPLCKPLYVCSTFSDAPTYFTTYCVESGSYTVYPYMVEPFPAPEGNIIAGLTLGALFGMCEVFPRFGLPSLDLSAAVVLPPSMYSASTKVLISS